MTAGPGPAALAAARGYLARGWSVVPVVAREKRPLVKWEALQTTPPTAKQLDGWFRRWPDANVGIVTGEVSNLIVLDIDPRHGGDRSLEELEHRYGPLPVTVEAIAGGGGRHLYFTHPGLETRNRTGLAPGIDLRGDGGYIVAPPSIHPSGAAYLWKPGHAPGEMAPAPLPHWLYRTPAGRGGRAGRSPEDWRRLVRDGVAEGERNATVAALTGHLLGHGIDPEVALELMLAWNRIRCRPPLAGDEVAQVVASIPRRHGTRDADGV